MDETTQRKHIRELKLQIKELKKDQNDLIQALGFAAHVLRDLPGFNGMSIRQIVDWIADNARKAC